jgi:putative toxin-antitoxin system antitoxin component (TIGR02293 family)
MSDVQKHTLVSAGLQTKDFVVVVKKFRHLEQAAVLKALGISSKTVGRNAHDKLNLQHSGAALALLEVIELARDVLGSQDEAEQWISRPAPALDGNKPIDLLTTPPGVAAVKDLLNRIDYGVYA